jgi:hypothetical protein
MFFLMNLCWAKIVSIRFLGEKMSALGKNVVVIKRYIRNLHGGSQPILAEASDGLLYVVKFINNLQGPNLLFNESAGSELYRACGLAVPLWKPLLIPDSFLDQNTDCWMQTTKGRLRPDSGLCFGSRFLGGNDISLLEILPVPYFKRVSNREDFWLAWLIDICACHVDNRQAIFREDGAGWLDAFFIDHGHLFGGPNGERRCHFVASRYLDPRIYLSVSSEKFLNLKKVALGLDVEQLWRKIQTLPEDWKTSSALDGFTQCLKRLSTSNLLQSIIDSMLDAMQRDEKREYEKHQNRQIRPLSVLCSGVQTPPVEYCFVEESLNCNACDQGFRGKCVSFCPPRITHSRSERGLGLYRNSATRFSRTGQAASDRVL